jgi:hypothetical protein
MSNKERAVPVGLAARRLSRMVHVDITDRTVKWYEPYGTREGFVMRS